MTKMELLKCINSFSWYGEPTTDKKFNHYQIMIFLSDAVAYTHDNPHSAIDTLPKINSALIDEYDIIDCDVMAKDSFLVLLCNDVELSTIHSIVSDFIEFRRNDDCSFKTNYDLYDFYETRIKKEKELMSNIEKGEKEQKSCSINVIGLNKFYDGGKIEMIDFNKHFPIYDRIKEDLPKCKHVNFGDDGTYALCLLYDVIDYCSDTINNLSRENIPEHTRIRRVNLTNVCDLPHFIGKKIDIDLNVVVNSTIDEEKTMHPVEINVWSNRRLIISRRYDKDADDLYTIVIPQ